MKIQNKSLYLYSFKLYLKLLFLFVIIIIINKLYKIRDNSQNIHLNFNFYVSKNFEKNFAL